MLRVYRGHLFEAAACPNVPPEWHFGASLMGGEVELLDELPPMTDEEKDIVETRLKFRKKLDHVNGLAGRVDTLKSAGASALARLSEAEEASFGFALNAALIGDAASGELVGGGDVERALDSYSLQERHGFLMSGSRDFLKQLAQREKQLQQQQLAQSCAHVKDGLMAGLAPHIAKYGVRLNDRMPLDPDKYVIASVIDAARSMQEDSDSRHELDFLFEQCAAPCSP